MHAGGKTPDESENNGGSQAAEGDRALTGVAVAADDGDDAEEPYPDFQLQRTQAGPFPQTSGNVDRRRSLEPDSGVQQIQGLDLMDGFG